MAALIRIIYDGYRHINENLSDPRTQDYFLIKSPWGYLSIILFYLYFVYELGPNIMAKRKPFNLDKILQIYNLIQIVSCGYIFYKAMVLAWLNDYSFYCQPVDYSYDPRAVEITRMVWLYFLIKLFDLLDTVFFVLRKKQQQISFLHVYHHTGMTFGTWVCTKFLPGGHITLLGNICYTTCRYDKLFRSRGYVHLLSDHFVTIKQTMVEEIRDPITTHTILCNTGTLYIAGVG
ncbi:elongation of very long chain fatty acids protein 7-like isoform X2 [Apis cerana]|uniref:elongation of very long chain fatty acids protein 7-like isoform X2 n=1 Tax=Apis cerana TaxID=7461 RepID=UPI002B231279|nr:elongation of very long chain fatty acids protein 7-like isoform X2 [Apis cerana]